MCKLYRVTNLLTVFCNVSNAVATVAKILIFLAFACKMTVLVALEALFATSAKSSISVAAISSATAGTTLWAFPSKVAHSVALVTRAGTHVLNLQKKR